MIYSPLWIVLSKCFPRFILDVVVETTDNNCETSQFHNNTKKGAMKWRTSSRNRLNQAVSVLASIFHRQVRPKQCIICKGRLQRWRVRITLKNC